MTFFKKILFSFRYKRAVHKANTLNNLTGLTYMVLMWKGKPRALPKKQIKLWIAERRFKRGLTLQDIEQGAMYIVR